MIKPDDIKLNEDGTIELNEYLQDEIFGGTSPEETEEELNICCEVHNNNCGRSISD